VFGLDRDDTPVIEDAAVPADVATDVLPIVDRDHDGVDDPVDPCIASAADNAADDDNDGIANELDSCPYNLFMTGDADGDGIPDACDPFTSEGGDHHLCVMTFTEPQLANVMWLPRAAPEVAWAANPGSLRAIPSGNEIATVIAATSLEGANVTTYQGVFSFTTNNKPGGITLWLRANPNESKASDVGCHVESMTSASPATIGVTTPTGFKDQKQLFFTAGANGLRIQGSLATVGTTVLATCRFTINNSAVTTSTAMVPLAPGRMGVTTDRWDTTLSGLYITDRP